ncbi:uncharacterized protein [Rutidosis leptorrhynchoides]|uniref:uncharacterized protein n=1 Tax=Rutidosis leptorrhynchoides TaxID=125765 RepID=UPI003A99BEDF
MDGSYEANNMVLVTVPTGRATDELLQLTNLLNSYMKSDRIHDRWAWKLSSNGVFTTRKLARLIDDHTILGNTSRQETLQNNLVPGKVEIFIWKVLRKRIATRVDLDKKGIDLDSVRCPMCDDGLESIDHSLFLCKYSFDVWERVFKWWGLNAVSNLSVNEAFRGKCNRTMSPLGSKIWQATEWTCAYLLWRNRNLKVFSNKSCCASTTLMEIQLKSFDWISNRVKNVKIEWLDWLSNPQKYVSC